MLGLAFAAGSDQFIVMSMAQVLQIPAVRPTFEREVFNRMYSPSAFYIANALAGVIVFFLYPMGCASVSYWYFGLKQASWWGMLDWMGCLYLPALAGSLYGYSLGSLFNSEITAL